MVGVVFWYDLVELDIDLALFVLRLLDFLFHLLELLVDVVELRHDGGLLPFELRHLLGEFVVPWLEPI